MERDRIKAAKQMIARARRIEAAAGELERAGRPLHTAFIAEATRLRVEAARMMGGPN